MMYKEAKEMNQQLLAWRRQIHHHPELGCRLPQTTALVKKALDDMSISWEEIGPCAIVGVIGKKEGKKILLRADMDALPMGEETGLPFASECDGVMHSCGHDCHTSMLLTAAALLKKHEEELQGQVILMFQPDEEGTDGTGARMMVENGLLDKYKPDVAVMAHMASDIVKTNQIMLKSGPCSASSDRFVVHLHGKGGHGARPHQSINPITCAIKIAEAFGDIGRYEVDVQEPTALSICTFHSGTASNIIPEDCEFTGTLRTFNDEARQFTLDRMQQVAQSIADAYRCQLTFDRPRGIPPLINDPEFSQQLHTWLQETIGQEGVDIPPMSYTKSMGSEDFSFISSRVPSCSFSVGSTSHQEQVYPLHHPKIIFDEDGLAAGAAAYAQAAYSYLTK